MITPLQAFLIEESGSTKEQEVIVSKRLAEHPFKIRALSLSEYEEVRKQSIDRSGDTPSVDGVETARNLVIVGCVEPDFKNAEFLAECKCVTPSQALNKLLLAGEVLHLSDEIMRASGFDKDLDKLKKQAKN